MSSSNNNATTTSPIPIAGRGRSSSIASSIPALSTSPTSPLQASIQTPPSTLPYRMGSNPHQRSASDNSPVGAPGTSPTSPLAYFLGAATSPVRSNASTAFPFGTNKAPITGASAIAEDEESPPGGANIGLFGMGAHTRRGSWAQNGGFASGTGTTGYQASNDRGTGVLRRLSLSGAFQRPNMNNSPTSPVAPPPTAVSTSPTVPTLEQPRPGRKGRGATMSVSDPSKKRGISPMGERLLKGHFDGFI